jgi:hypothetical protein
MLTLADVRGQILAMPPEGQSSPTWRHATALVMTAACSETIDTKKVTVAVEMALHRDGRLAPRGAEVPPLLAAAS